jgi:Asp-tRNA(Asn)/Glu-tRNA(Gln) amidotransferase A subunit family amidase
MHGPCITIPAFSGPNGLPVGVQVVGPPGADAATLAAAAWIADGLGRSAG